jgi:hypothetical protein
MFYLFMTILKGESWIVVTLNGSKERRTNTVCQKETKRKYLTLTTPTSYIKVAIIIALFNSVCKK